jgi:alanine racemase
MPVSQLTRFNDLLKRLQARGPLPPMVHMANSGAILDMPRSHFDACRSGIMLIRPLPVNGNLAIDFAETGHDP